MTQYLHSLREPHIRPEIIAYFYDSGANLILLARDAITRLGLDRKPA